MGGGDAARGVTSQPACVNLHESCLEAIGRIMNAAAKEIHVTRRLPAFSDRPTPGASGCPSVRGRVDEHIKGRSFPFSPHRSRHRPIMASEESTTGLLGAVSSAAQQATSVVSSALEAMHITAPHDQDAAAQNGSKGEGETENSKEQASRPEDKDTEDLEEGEIRETNGKEDKQGPRTVFDDPASFNLKVCRCQRRSHLGSRHRFDSLT